MGWIIVSLVFSGPLFFMVIPSGYHVKTLDLKRAVHLWLQGLSQIWVPQRNWWINIYPSKVVSLGDVSFWDKIYGQEHFAHDVCQIRFMWIKYHDRPRHPSAGVVLHTLIDNVPLKATILLGNFTLPVMVDHEFLISSWVRRRLFSNIPHIFSITALQHATHGVP